MKFFPVFSEALHRPYIGGEKQWNSQDKSCVSESISWRISASYPEVSSSENCRIRTYKRYSMYYRKGSHENPEFFAKWHEYFCDSKIKYTSKNRDPENYPEYEYCLPTTLFYRIPIREIVCRRESQNNQEVSNICSILFQSIFHGWKKTIDYVKKIREHNNKKIWEFESIFWSLNSVKTSHESVFIGYILTCSDYALQESFHSGLFLHYHEGNNNTGKSVDSIPPSNSRVIQ